jgi:hypothetical protein
VKGGGGSQTCRPQEVLATALSSALVASTTEHSSAGNARRRACGCRLTKNPQPRRAAHAKQESAETTRRRASAYLFARRASMASCRLRSNPPDLRPHSCECRLRLAKRARRSSVSSQEEDDRHCRRTDEGRALNRCTRQLLAKARADIIRRGVRRLRRSRCRPVDCACSGQNVITITHRTQHGSGNAERNNPEMSQRLDLSRILRRKEVSMLRIGDKLPAFDVTAGRRAPKTARARDDRGAA